MKISETPKVKYEVLSVEAVKGMSQKMLRKAMGRRILRRNPWVSCQTLIFTEESRFGQD